MSGNGGASGGANVLFGMTFDKACALKDKAGKDNYRPDGGEWVGAHPLVEGHDETLDLRNYLDRSSRRGIPCDDLVLLVHHIREEIRRRAREAGVA